MSSASSTASASGAPHPALTAFHPTVAAWFSERIGTPTAAQAEAWPRIRSGQHVLIAAPTGSGKTLAACLCAADALLAQGPWLPAATRVLYVSPLRALANDVQKNLHAPLAELAERDAVLPRLRVAVRTGDSTPAERSALVRQAPHILVTTPESLAVLLTSASGRRMLADVRSVIVDEIHAVAGSKRGAHLALSLERLAHLIGEAQGTPLQRIGLSATQRPLARIADFLVGAGRTCAVVDAGHLRALDLGVLTPDSPLEAVCSHAAWGEAYRHVLRLITAHRTTLVFVATRKLAERVALRLSETCAAALADAVDHGAPTDAAAATGLPSPDRIACHHGSMSVERRHAAEQALKSGQLRCLVATATLELGIDIGAVDLVIQIGSPRAIGTFLQRAGRAGHGVGRVPKARILALTLDELVEAAALVRALRAGELDVLTVPLGAADVLAQQAVAACVDTTWSESDLIAVLTRADPYRTAQADAAAVLALHSVGRFALLHRDSVAGTVRGTRRARLTALTCSGAIPDTAQYQVREDPGDALVGTLDEDFSLESGPGDVFQLGSTAWMILRVDGRAGVVRVRHAGDAPPTIPFWVGEAPGRTREFSRAVGQLRADCPPQDAVAAAWLMAHCLLDAGAAAQATTYLGASRQALGQLPTDACLVVERFRDEVGGQHLCLHSPFGTRVNRAYGLALRKRFCTSFGFELEAAANDDAVLLSLAPGTGFALDEVFAYLVPDQLRRILTTAVLTGGQFETRWRWAAQIALLVERFRGGARTPPHLLRLRAGDALHAAFPDATACADNLPPDRIRIPDDHPIVQQALRDCLDELMDATGLAELITGIRDGRIQTHAVDTAEASPLARGILAARPYAFLDDVPFEERRSRAVQPSRGVVASAPAGALDPGAIAEVRAEAWPDIRDAEELHETLQWIGFLTDAEAAGWRTWLDDLAAAGRVEQHGGRWFAAHSPRDEQSLWRGRLQALGPVPFDAIDAITAAALEAEGTAVRVRIAASKSLEVRQSGRQPDSGLPDSQTHPAWCHARLLARIQRLMLERRRAAWQPVSIRVFLRFLAAWQGADPAHRRSGRDGLAATLHQLAGLELPAAAWAGVLSQRVRDLRPSDLDDLTLRGDVAWGRLWNAAPEPTSPDPCGITASHRSNRADASIPHASPTDAPHSAGVSSTTARLPIAFVPRSELADWQRLAGPADARALSPAASTLLDRLRQRGALFPAELFAGLRLLPEHAERALSELVARGLVSSDAVAGLRWLLLPSDRRGRTRTPAGRWSLWRAAGNLPASAPLRGADTAQTPLERDNPGFAPLEATGSSLAVRAARERGNPGATGDDHDALLLARTLLRRTGIACRVLAERERFPLPWRDLARVLRTLELRGEVLGGRFITGPSGEQFALPEAAAWLRRFPPDSRMPADSTTLRLSADDPLNYTGILIPGPRIRGAEAHIEIGP